ncbi:MAG: MaoC family dehydratase [Deltaproteobacteria bacterium]|nr:MAG: MaoC family dehydratase [Deltaproteobacteria bacterium]
MSDILKKTIQGLKVGDTFSITRAFSEADMVQFADITRDYNPVHFDDRFATVKRFSGRICHGLLIASMLTEIGGQIGWLASRMDFRFKKPVYYGDAIKCSLTITKIDEGGRAEAEAIFQNRDGVIVIEAFLTGILPGGKEKKVLKAMLAEGDPTNKAG